MVWGSIPLVPYYGCGPSLSALLPRRCGEGSSGPVNRQDVFCRVEHSPVPTIMIQYTYWYSRHWAML